MIRKEEHKGGGYLFQNLMFRGEKERTTSLEMYSSTEKIAISWPQ